MSTPVRARIVPLRKTKPTTPARPSLQQLEALVLARTADHEKAIATLADYEALARAGERRCGETARALADAYAALQQENDRLNDPAG